MLCRICSGRCTTHPSSPGTIDAKPCATHDAPHLTTTDATRRPATGGGTRTVVRAARSRSAQAEKRGTERPRTLITLWMGGGPSQMDTWDPHPTSKNSGPIQALPTTAGDLQIAHLLPQMAEQMHHLTLIRSLVSKEGDHERGTYFVQTGYRPDPTVVHPALGPFSRSSCPTTPSKSPCMSRWRPAMASSSLAEVIWATSTTPSASTIRGWSPSTIIRRQSRFCSRSMIRSQSHRCSFQFLWRDVKSQNRESGG